MTDQLVSPEVAAVSDLIDLTGQRALITGGAKGIGAAIARRLAEAGAVVTVGDIDDTAGEDPDVAFIRCDITRPDDVDAAVRAAAGDDDHLD
ncbi:MAG: SDR family NAD(P)-dependent oxidoreductase, partial [Acidobacteriota bacterium]